MEGRRDYIFENWAKTYKCRPDLFFEPESLQEVKQILGKAKNDGKVVKVVGNGHSPSDIACTDGYMISMRNFRRVLQIDTSDKTVKVEAGILLSELNQLLDDNGLALSVIGSVSDITLAGALSVGTHGTGLLYGAIHTFILEIDLMCADGELLAINMNDNADLFHAACLGLGALGIIVAVKLQCEPAFRLHQIQYGLPLTDVIENIDVHLSSSDHFRFCWYPHTDECIVFHSNRTGRPTRRQSSWFWEYFVGYYVLEFLYWLSTFFPSLVRWINRSYCKLYSSKMEIIDKSFNVFNFNCLFRQYVMEWAVPRENMGLILYQLKTWTERNFRAAHFPVEVRFVKQDDAFLSPSYGTDTCYINIIMYRPYNKDVAFQEYWTAFQEMMLKAGGRPHWAKDYRLTPKQLKNLYPCWDKFEKIRNQLDPGRLFINNNLRRIFPN